MRFLVPAVAFLLALVGCHGRTDPPGEAPTNVQAFPGDGLVLLTWDTLPDMTYWIFFQPGSSVTAAALGSIAIRRAVPPRTVPFLINGTQYAFVMNATHDDSAAGPSSPVVLATPRLAGADWLAGAPVTPQDLKALAIGGSRFVAVGNAATIFAGDQNYASTSPPGVTAWTPASSLPPGFASNLSSVLFNGAFVALATDGSVIASADGLNWTPANASVPSAGMNGIAFGVLQTGTAFYVAVGDGGKIFKGDLASPWTQVGIGVTANDLTDISFLNGAFFATGANGTLLLSQNGTDWNAQQTNTASALRGMAFSASPLTSPTGIRFVAVGGAGTIITSTDISAANWTVITPPPLGQNLRSVTLGGALGRRFLAVGEGGAVAFSDDGLTWQTASSGASNLSKVLFAGALYLGVGDGGANAVSK